MKNKQTNKQTNQPTNKQTNNNNKKKHSAQLRQAKPCLIKIWYQDALKFVFSNECKAFSTNWKKLNLILLNYV